MTENYSTVEQLSQKYPAFPQRKLRYLILKRDANGFSRCIRRIGKNIVINENEFVAWIEDQRTAA